MTSSHQSETYVDHLPVEPTAEGHAAEPGEAIDQTGFADSALEPDTQRTVPVFVDTSGRRIRMVQMFASVAAVASLSYTAAIGLNLAGVPMRPQGLLPAAIAEALGGKSHEHNGASTSYQAPVIRADGRGNAPARTPLQVPRTIGRSLVPIPASTGAASSPSSAPSAAGDSEAANPMSASDPTPTSTSPTPTETASSQATPAESQAPVVVPTTTQVTSLSTAPAAGTAGASSGSTSTSDSTFVSTDSAASGFAPTVTESNSTSSSTTMTTTSTITKTTSGSTKTVPATASATHG